MRAMRLRCQPRPSFDLTEAKLKAMTTQAEEFYSQYQGQTWKNIISDLGVGKTKNLNDGRNGKMVVKEYHIKHIKAAWEMVKTKDGDLWRVVTLNRLMPQEEVKQEVKQSLIS